MQGVHLEPGGTVRLMQGKGVSSREQQRFTTQLYTLEKRMGKR